MITFRDAEGELASVRVLLAQVVSVCGTDDVAQAMEELRFRFDAADKDACAQVLAESLDWLVREGKLNNEEKWCILDDVGDHVAMMQVLDGPMGKVLLETEEAVLRKFRGRPLMEHLFGSLFEMQPIRAEIDEMKVPLQARWLRAVGEEMLATMLERGDARYEQWTEVGRGMLSGRMRRARRVG